MANCPENKLMAIAPIFRANRSSPPRNSHFPGSARVPRAVSGVPPDTFEFSNCDKVGETPTSTPGTGVLPGKKSAIVRLIALLLLASPAYAENKPESLAFGSTENTGDALIGIFYDFKQNQKGEPQRVDYFQVVGEFLNSGWDENTLSRFFRVTRPIYGTQVFIPNIGAGAGPKAFHVEDVVKPEQWIVVYKGQVSPPEDGTYRFVGIADDALAVAVNGKTSLVSHFGGWANYSSWKEPEPDKPNLRVGSGKLRHGDWFEAKQDEIIDLDILIGEFPGTAFGAALLIEKKGVDYPLVDVPGFGKIPAYPVFQVRAQEIAPGNYGVPFTSDSPPWKCHQ